MSKSKTTMFDSLYGITKEEIAASRKPIVKRELQRSFEKAYDNKLDQKISAQNQLKQMQEDIKSYSMEKYLNLNEEIRNCDYTMERISEHYEEMFGEKLVRNAS